MDTEKESPIYTEHIEDSRRHHKHHGHSLDKDTDAAIVVDAGLAGKEEAGVSSLKLARDGHTILIPQPSDDPNDPLNWSSGKKHMILLIVALSAFLGDFGSGAGIPCIVAQGAEWNMSPNQVNYAGNLNVLMLGIGGVLWIPFIYWWGRAPVVFWTTLSGSLFTIGCALTHDFTTFYALRALMGLTLTCCQTVGLAYIKDMFYFHEHARKIGLWAGLFLVAPYSAPLFGNFIIARTGEWRPVFWMVFGVACLDLVLIALFLDESWYRRDIPVNSQPLRGSRISRILGVWQTKHHRRYFLTAWVSVRRMVTIFIKPVVIPVLLYYMMSFMWAVGINITSSILLATPESAGGYGFSTLDVGFLYFTPVVAIAIGESFGHFFNDYIAARYIRRHSGVFQPEARLVANYLAAFLMIPGLVIVGQALEKHLHWAAIVMGWGVYVVGVMVASVAITAYCLDSYPTASGEVSALLNMVRTIGGFSVGYFQSPWGHSDGYGVSFGIQAAIVGIAVGILAILQIWGRGMRERGGPLRI